MLNVGLSDNPSTEPSHHDADSNDGLVDGLSISKYTENIYKYLCRVLRVLSNELNR